MPRSSIIVSDEPLSSETNYRTEFVAVLNNYPQGGFLTRQSSNDLVASQDNGSFDFFSLFEDDSNARVARARRQRGRLQQDW